MNIFVAKLNPGTDADGLKEHFSPFGEVVSTKVIMDRDTGKSKCFGFVEMQNDDEGSQAITALDQSELDGNTIVVKKSDPKPESSGNNYRNNDRRPNNRYGNNDRGRNDRGRNDNNRYDNRRGDNRRSNNNNDDQFDTSRW